MHVKCIFKTYGALIDRQTFKSDGLSTSRKLEIPYPVTAHGMDKSMKNIEGDFNHGGFNASTEF